MKNRKFLSIITCTYNSEKYLQECIDSVILQKLDPNEFEHIFVDWYSTDKTIKIIKDYQNTISNYNIKIIQSPAKWIYNAMNIWIKEAKWKYLNMLNSDDYREPDIIKDYIDFIKKTWEKEIYCGYNYDIYDNWNKKERHHKYMWKILNLDRLLEYNPTNHQAIFYQKSLHDKFGKYEEKFEILADYRFRLTLWQKNITAIWFKKYIVNFRCSGKSQNPKNLILVLLENINIKKKIIPFLKYIKIKTNTFLYIYITQYIIKFFKYIKLYSIISPLWKNFILRKKYE